jgi:putative membrane protein
VNRSFRLTAPALAALIALSAPAFAQNATAPGDPDFIHAIALANNGEIDEAKYMIAHASSPVVKSFAQKMLADHRAAGKKLQALAASLTPQERLPVNEVAPATQNAYQNLESRKGAQLDANYMSDQLVDHQNVLELLTAEAQHGQLPAVRRFAAQLRPVIAMHLAMVRGFIASKGKNDTPAS